MGIWIGDLTKFTMELEDVVHCLFTTSSKFCYLCCPFVLLVVPLYHTFSHLLRKMGCHEVGGKCDNWSHFLGLFLGQTLPNTLMGTEQLQFHMQHTVQEVADWPIMDMVNMMYPPPNGEIAVACIDEQQDSKG